MKEIIDLTGSLHRCVKNLQLYGAPSHPRCIDAFRDVKQRLEALLDSRERFQLVVSQGRVFFDSEPLTEKSMYVDWLIERFTERRINGFVFTRGVTVEEIDQLVRIFVVKPQKLEDGGGTAQLLTDGDVRHIRLTHVRYGELREGEVIVSGVEPGERARTGSVPPAGSAASPGVLPTASPEVVRRPDPVAVAGGVPPRGDVPGGIAVPELPVQALANEEILRDLASRITDWVRERGFRSSTGTATRDGDDAPSAHEHAGTAVHGSLEGVPAERVRFAEHGGGSDPTGATGAAEPAPSSADVAGGADAVVRLERYEHLLTSLTRYMKQNDVDLELLQKRLHEFGITKDDLDVLLEALSWTNLPIEERLGKCLDGSAVFGLPLEKVLSFVFQLLREQRVDEAILVIKKLGSGLFAESAEARRIAIDAFNRMTEWLRRPGVPQPVEEMLERILLTYFVRGQDPDVQARTQQAFENFYDYWIATEQTDKAYRSLRRLEASANAASEAAPWKKKAYLRLLVRLTSVERMRSLFGQMYERDLDFVAEHYYPLLIFFDDTAALRLIDALEAEQDQVRRGRLIRALKAIGKPALYHLRAALTSSTQHLVRNALILIGDLGSPDLVEEVAVLLGHDEDRVRRAAARALGKIGGLRAERSLAEALPANDGETRGEILLAIGSLKAKSAIDGVLELTKARGIGRRDEPLRIRAIETAGQIGSSKAIPALVELVRRRGLLAGSESPEIRAAAARSLKEIGTPEALAALESLLAAEPDDHLRSRLR